MTPEMVPTPLFVIDRLVLAASLIAAALRVSVLTVNPVRAVVLPTAPVNVVSPVVLVVKVLAPCTVAPNARLPALVLVRLVFDSRVTAPV
jgi:hypothetical protein